jgi:hypothetical protein
MTLGYHLGCVFTLAITTTVLPCSLHRLRSLRLRVRPGRGRPRPRTWTSGSTRFPKGPHHKSPAARRKRNEISPATIISFALLFSSWSRGRFRAHRSLQRRCNHTVLTTEVSPIPSCNRGSRRGPGREEQALPLPPGRLNLSPHGPRARAPASCPWVLRLFINKKI